MSDFKNCGWRMLVDKGDTNMEEKIVVVLNEMSEYLSITQMKKLQEVIIKTFAGNEASKSNINNEDFLSMFLSAKRIEGCSERTIKFIGLQLSICFLRQRRMYAKLLLKKCVSIYLIIRNGIIVPM